MIGKLKKVRRTARSVIVSDVFTGENIEEIYRDLVEKAGIGILVDDERGNFVFFNDQFVDFFGYEPEALRESAIGDLVHPEDVDLVMSYHRRRLRGGDVPARYEFRGIRKNGSTIHLEIAVTILRKGGKAVGTRSYMWDITERKRTEEELRKSEEQFRLIAEHTGDNIAITTFDRKAQYIYVSPSVRRVIGLREEDLLGRSFFEFIHPDDKKSILPVLLKYLNMKLKKLITGNESNISETIEYRFKNRSGKWRNFQSTVTLMGNKMLSVTRDITRQIEDREEILKLKQGLESEVEKKTKELQEKITDLERFYDAAVDRELRMEELFTEISLLREENKKLRGE
jgi:PAS domain S-box-containing protein